MIDPKQIIPAKETELSELSKLSGPLPPATENLPRCGSARLADLHTEPWVRSDPLNRKIHVVWWGGEILRAVRTKLSKSGKAWIFAEPCPYCSDHHLHSASEGPRNSNCTVPHPRAQDGYYLLSPGQSAPTL
jgi:hypothetical protein